MKTFNLDLVEFPKLKRITVDGTRHYIREGSTQEPYPSVTSITSQLAKEGIKKWRKRVGAEVANAITTKATRQGTRAHILIEHYLESKELPESMPNEIELYLGFKKVADDHIDNIRSIEGQMMSDYLRVAGTVDLIAEYDGKLSVIDWKTSAKPKKEEWVSGYFMQESAYAVMFEENTKTPIQQLVTIISCSSGEMQIFIQKRDDWIQKFIDLRETYDRVSDYRKHT
jgi:ATP-dependent exoDNAse (exonuclease V) beta subunit|tara:strand:+ start:178 stop:858 length:681 start_codon:yes stop_codon:yes gene_type:complete